MNPNRLRSLLDLLRLYAPDYMRIARICEEYTSSIGMLAANSTAVPTDEQLVRVMGNFESIAEICERMHLSVSKRSVDKIIDQFQAKRPNFRETKRKFLEWYACFESEVEGQIYLLVLPHRVAYWNSEADRLEGTESAKLVRLLANFPDAKYDAREAGNCFAFGRFSACVHHLMRLAEHGLVSVAASVNVPEEKISKGWDGCIQGIESAIKNISSTKPTGDWQDQVKKYSDLCSWFTTIKSGWRNPSSHVPRIYSEQSAVGIFSAVRTLFEHLNQYGFRQTKMPPDPLMLP
jgi:hypothetical protein